MTTQTEPQVKMTTRSSFRHSLGLTSVGKALADVINNGKSDPDREKQKEKGMASSKAKASPSTSGKTRRMSAIGLMQGNGRPRQSLDTVAESVKKQKLATMETPVTRHSRRSSVQPRTSSVTPNADYNESGVKSHSPVGDSASPRGPTARARGNTTSSNSSALPKYRPRSVIVENPKLISPIKKGSRKRTSTPDDENVNFVKTNKMKGSITTTTTQVTLTSPGEKLSRPISPLPQRSFKVNLSTSKNSNSNFMARSGTPASGKGSPIVISRSSSKLKAAPPATQSPSTLPRPPSSSSISSGAPRTPKMKASPSSFRSALFGGSKGGKDIPLPVVNVPSPKSVRGTPAESPLAQHSRQHNKSQSTSYINITPTSRSQYQGHSDDSFDADDVEILLGPTAALGAPTPAIPRIKSSRYRPDVSRHDKSFKESSAPTGKTPQTPTRSSNSLLPSRAALSYLSPEPPSPTNSSPSLRPPRLKAGNERGSILSWEQLANQSANDIGVDEVGAMLADLPLPSFPVSPGPGAALLIPESPALNVNNLASPGGYGSISQVLLPEVTPSPAPHPDRSTLFNEVTTNSGGGGGATATLLRLQLAAAETNAKERLTRVLTLEDALYDAQAARARDAEALAAQVAVLEAQLRAGVEARERADEERAAYTASLEDKLRHADAYRERGIEYAVLDVRAAERRKREEAVSRERRRGEQLACIGSAKVEWECVKEVAEDELEFIKSSRKCWLCCWPDWI